MEIFSFGNILINILNCLRNVLEWNTLGVISALNSYLLGILSCRMPQGHFYSKSVFTGFCFSADKESKGQTQSLCFHELMAKTNATLTLINHNIPVDLYRCLQCLILIRAVSIKSSSKCDEDPKLMYLNHRVYCLFWHLIIMLLLFHAFFCCLHRK